MDPTDYRELLKKYINHVGECEGVTFIHKIHRVRWEGTEEEWQVLRELDRETSGLTQEQQDELEGDD